MSRELYDKHEAAREGVAGQSLDDYNAQQTRAARKAGAVTDGLDELKKSVDSFLRGAVEAKPCAVDAEYRQRMHRALDHILQWHRDRSGDSQFLRRVGIAADADKPETEDQIVRRRRREWRSGRLNS